MNEPPEMTWIEYGILGAEYVRKDVSDAKVAAAVKAEREACAQLADFMSRIGPGEFIAAAIRARGGDNA